MNSDCDRLKDRITDFVSGILPEAEIHALQQHLGECSACRAYAEALRKEDQLLAGLFAKFDAGMPGREDEVINAISQLDAAGRRSIISVSSATVKTLLAKHAAAAAVIIVVTLYFIITLTWISQINECIRHCL
jgi:anti-sigma factor RsiW